MLAIYRRRLTILFFATRLQTKTFKLSVLVMQHMRDGKRNKFIQSTKSFKLVPGSFCGAEFISIKVQLIPIRNWNNAEKYLINHPLIALYQSRRLLILHNSPRIPLIRAYATKEKRSRLIFAPASYRDTVNVMAN